MGFSMIESCISLKESDFINILEFFIKNPMYNISKVDSIENNEYCTYIRIHRDTDYITFKYNKSAIDNKMMCVAIEMDEETIERYNKGLM